MQQTCKVFKKAKRQKARRSNRQAFDFPITYRMAYEAGES